MDLCHVVISIFFVVCVHADGYKTVSSNFSTDLQDEPDLIVREDVKVTLLCPRTASFSVYITVANSRIRGGHPKILVEGSKLNDVSSKYGFNETDYNMYAFTINRISQYDEGTYRCVQGHFIQTRVIKVIYSPSASSPRCSSNYKSPIIFHDEITNDFVFNCSTERGKPPVTTKTYVNEQEVTSELETASETRTDEDNIFTTYSLFRQFNDTLQNSEFVCNVTQQLPSPYDDYQGSCSFGPLHILPGFSLHVSPSNITVREERSVTLTCTSNVTEVEITWHNIPSEKYIVTNYSRSSVLTILSFKPASYETIFVECSGSYGSRTITANATFVLMFTPNADDPEKEDDKEHANGTSKTFVAGPSIVSVCIITMLVVVALFIFRLWNKKKRKEAPIEASPGNNVLGNRPTCTSIHRQNHILAGTEESNINNGNNTAIYQKDDDMCDNIIYEPASYGNMNEFGEKEKVKSCENRDPCFGVKNYVFGDEHIMCENVIYQSVSFANKEGRNNTDLVL